MSVMGRVGSWLSLQKAGHNHRIPTYGYNVPKPPIRPYTLFPRAPNPPNSPLPPSGFPRFPPISPYLPHFPVFCTDLFAGAGF